MQSLKKMPLKLYYDILSQPSRAVLIFLKANNIPHTETPVALRKGEHLTEEYKKINPFQKVPVIDDDGFVLTESVAILRYLCREKTVADYWYPRDSLQQARVDEFLEWQHLNLRANCMLYFRTKVLTPLLTQTQPSDEEVSKRETAMLQTLDHVMNVWLKDRPFIAGNHITIADLLASCEIEQPRMAGYDAFEKNNILREWRERVIEHTKPHYSENHTAIPSMHKRFQQALNQKL